MLWCNKNGTCSTGIPYGYQSMSHLLHFSCNSFNGLRKLAGTVPLFGSMPSMFKTQMNLQASAWSTQGTATISGVKQQMEDLFMSLMLSKTLSFKWVNLLRKKFLNTELLTLQIVASSRRVCKMFILFFLFYQCTKIPQK